MRLNHVKDLGPLRERSLAQLNADAALALAAFVTPGRESVYRAKATEAEAIIMMPNISDGQVPHIASEARLNNISNEAQAIRVLTKIEECAVASAAIEVLRMAAKQLIMSATNPAEIEAALAVNWDVVKT